MKSPIICLIILFLIVTISKAAPCGDDESEPCKNIILNNLIRR